MTAPAPILYSAKHSHALIARLKADGITHIHMTKGAYASRKQEIIAEMPETTKAGFQFVEDHLVRNSASDTNHAFIIAVHGKEGMVRDYGVDPSTVDSDQERAARVIPAVREHFSKTDIPVYGAVFDDLAAISLEEDLHQASFTLASTHKFGAWGIAEDKFIVAHEAFEWAGTFPYADQAKKAYMQDSGPWDNTQKDSRDVFRSEVGIGFFHASSQYHEDPQTWSSEIVDLYSKGYLRDDNSFIHSR